MLTRPERRIFVALKTKINDDTYVWTVYKVLRDGSRKSVYTWPWDWSDVKVKEELSKLETREIQRSKWFTEWPPVMTADGGQTRTP